MSLETPNKPNMEASICNMPEPTPQHRWLEQFVGQWDGECQCFMAPDNAPNKTQGTENIQSLGGQWIVVDIQNPSMGFRGLQTLGYDAACGRYIGTWVDSFTNHLWTYEGSVDAEGKALTLYTEGPCPMRPGKISRFREVIEVQSADSKTFTSYLQEEDGQWTKMMSVSSRRRV